jgi:hypothetical protein
MFSRFAVMETLKVIPFAALSVEMAKRNLPWLVEVVRADGNFHAPALSRQNEADPKNGSDN